MTAVSILSIVCVVFVTAIIAFFYRRHKKLKKIYHAAFKCEINGDYEKAVDLYSRLIDQCFTGYDKKRKIVKDARQRRHILNNHLRACSPKYTWRPLRKVEDFH